MKIQQSKSALQILLIYTAAQIVPVFVLALLPKNPTLQLYGSVYGTLAAFVLGAFAMIWLNKKNDYTTPIDEQEPLPLLSVVLWGIAGLFIALFAQQIAAIIETVLFNLPQESANTQSLFALTQKFPVFFVIIGIAGPIMEEFVFRKVIFGSLIEHVGLIGAAIVSALLFAFIHMDGHLLVYSSMAFVFSFLYVKTKSLKAPIIAHVLMNTAAIWLQFATKGM